MYQRKWGTDGRGAENVYRYRSCDVHRLGHNAFQPRDGDLCVPIRHSGDHFHTYAAYRNGRKVGEFGAYTFGERVSGYSMALTKSTRGSQIRSRCGAR